MVRAVRNLSKRKVCELKRANEVQRNKTILDQLEQATQGSVTIQKPRALLLKRLQITHLLHKLRTTFNKKRVCIK